MSDAQLESVDMEESLDDAIAAELSRIDEEVTDVSTEEDVAGREASESGNEPAESAEDNLEPANLETEQEEEKLTPYDHWKADYKEAFSGMSRGHQEAWLAREKEFDQGMLAKGQELRQAKMFVSELHGIIEPVVNDWARQGLQPAAGVRRAIALEQALRDNPQEALVQLARERGVDLQQTWAEQPYEDPAIREMRKQNEELKNTIEHWQKQQSDAQQAQQAQAQQNAEQQILAMRDATDESGSPRFPYLEHVMGNMAQILNNGHAQSLESAYQLAVQEMRNHPILKEALASQTRQTADSRTKEAEKAKNAARAVDSNTTGATNQPKTLDEDILEALEANL